MPNSTVLTTAGVQNMAIDRKLRALAVALPGIVLSYDAVTETCSVQPAVHRLRPSKEDEDVDIVRECSPLQDVPVAWPRGFGFSLAGALRPGDPVLLLATDRDMGNWRGTGAAAEPFDARLHDWGSCVAIPGLVPRTNPFPPPSDAAALASRVDTLISILKSWIPVTSDGGAALQAAVAAAFPNIPHIFSPPTPVTESTTGSTLLKLEE